MTTFNLSVRETYATISEDDLEKAIGDIQLAHPYWGNHLMYGYLLSIGIRVPFHRVREAQARYDPEGSFIRRPRFLNRRRYSVPGSRAQWLCYIDGNHKLIRLVMNSLKLHNCIHVVLCIRWKLVINGGIDAWL